MKKRQLRNRLQEIAKTGIGQSKKRPNQGKRWTEEHDSLLIVHYKNGMSTDELAELLGRGEFSIGVRLVKLGRLGRNSESRCLVGED